MADTNAEALPEKLRAAGGELCRWCGGGYGHHEPTCCHLRIGLVYKPERDHVMQICFSWGGEKFVIPSPKFDAYVALPNGTRLAGVWRTDRNSQLSFEPLRVASLSELATTKNLTMVHAETLP